MRYSWILFAAVPLAVLAAGCSVSWETGSPGFAMQTGGKTTTITRNNNSVLLLNDTPDAVLSASFPNDKGKPLSVFTEFGSIKVTASPDGKIGAKAIIQISQDKLDAANRKALAARFQVRLVNVENTRLEVLPPDDFDRVNGYTVSWEVSVPKNLSLVLQSANGAVSIENTRTVGNVKASSSFGSVTVAGLDRVQALRAGSDNGTVTVRDIAEADNVVAESSFGSVTVQGVKQSKSITATSDNGTVTVQNIPQTDAITARSSFGAVRVSQTASRSINAQSDNGTVTFTGDAARVTLKSSFGAVSGILGAGATLTGVNISSDNGAVSLTLPAAASITLNAETDNGQLILSGVDAKPTGDDGKKLSTSINGGRASVTARSGFGNVSVTRR